MSSSFEEDVTPACDEERLLVEVEGFEGPLDLLLELARRQKVDLQKISVLALAEQYLAFIEAARAVRLELAADYLVMAAWLAYLKSKLLLPAAPTESEPDARELAAALAERLRRLEIIRAAARALEARPQLGRDMLLRGSSDEPPPEPTRPAVTATLYELVAAYARGRRTGGMPHVQIAARTVWSLAEARQILLDADVGADWIDLAGVLKPFLREASLRRSAQASTFAVALELVKEGRLALRQDAAFAPLWIRLAAPPALASAATR